MARGQAFAGCGCFARLTRDRAGLEKAGIDWKLVENDGKKPDNRLSRAFVRPIQTGFSGQRAVDHRSLIAHKGEELNLKPSP